MQINVQKKCIFPILFILTILSFIAVDAQTSQITVNGTVTDIETGIPLIGATVLEKDRSRGTVTDIDGKYTLTVENSDAVLIFSYVSYETIERAINAQKILDVGLREDVAQIEEFVVVGYGVQKKKEVTGAIAKVTADDLEDMPVARVEQTLQGRTSGVTVTANSGQPGAASTVRVRGTTTINGSDPLYVVDGVIINGGIDFLNQNDIESVEVLKDASASIYGARAANGVILITTRKGITDRLQVNYSGSYGVQYPWRKMAVLNAREYAILTNESQAAAGQDLPFPDVDALAGKLGEGTDWQEEVFNKGAPIQNHNFSISAGSEKSQYYTSFGYFDQTGIVATQQSRYQRFNVRFNSTHKVFKFLTFGNTIGYSRVNGRGVSENDEFGSPLSRAVNLDPITPLIESDAEELSDSRYANNLANLVRDDDGNIYGISKYVTSEVLNPIAALKVLQNKGWSDKLVGNAFVEVMPLKDLKLRTSIGTDLAFWGSEGFDPIYYLNAANRKDQTSYNREQNRGLYWIWDATLSYEKSFGIHKLSAIVGTVVDKNQGEQIGARRSNLPVDNLEDASFGYFVDAESQFNYGYEYLNTSNSLFGRINYNISTKYLFSAILRRDGSSRFGNNYKYGYFPGFSVGWVVTDESFFNSNPAINFLKIRASWGSSGNDRIGDFRYISTLGGGRNYTFGLEDELVNGVSPNGLANPDLRWETTNQTNIGFDAKIFRNIGVTFDLFQKNTIDMLLVSEVPGYVGNNPPTANVAELENKGIEIDISYSKKFPLWKLNVSTNAAYIQNEITNLGFEKEFIPGQGFGPGNEEVTRTTLGEPIGHLFGFQTDGIFQNQAEIDAYTNLDGGPMQPDAAPGDFRFQDVNGDGFFTEDDRTIIGDPTPDFTYGVNLGAEWRGFDVALFGQGVWGNQIFKAVRRYDLQMANWTGDALERWTGEGTSNEFPRLIATDPNKNFSRSSDFYVEDGAYFRLRTAQLGYNFRLNEQYQKMRVYIAANNLVTLTKYSGFDPEIGGGSYGVDRGVYPQARSFVFGINVTY